MVWSNHYTGINAPSYFKGKRDNTVLWLDIWPAYFWDQRSGALANFWLKLQLVAMHLVLVCESISDASSDWLTENAVPFVFVVIDSIVVVPLPDWGRYFHDSILHACISVWKLQEKSMSCIIHHGCTPHFWILVWQKCKFKYITSRPTYFLFK